MNLLVVCLGNICRSPMAEGALHARLQASPLADRVQVDSAGTGDWHVGEATAAQRERLSLYLPWSGGQGERAIPDPYTGGQDHFEQVWAMVDQAAQRTVARLLHDAESGIIRP